MSTAHHDVRVRAETERDPRYVALCDASRVDDAQPLVRDALALVQELDAECEELEREVEREVERVDEEIGAIEESAEREVLVERETAHAWRAMVARVLGLGPYDERILTLDDADAKLRGVLR